MIQMRVERKPSYTTGLVMDHPLAKIQRRLSVDLVSGKKKDTILKIGYIPSIGQIIPHNITIGKKLPMAIYVALLSLSQEQATTNPENFR